MHIAMNHPEGHVAMHTMSTPSRSCICLRQAQTPQPTVIRPLTQRDQIMMMFMPELAELADPIEHWRAPGITASDGLRVLRVLDAVVSSGRGHQAGALGAPILAAY